MRVGALRLHPRAVDATPLRPLSALAAAKATSAWAPIAARLAAAISKAPTEMPATTWVAPRQSPSSSPAVSGSTGAP
jgi:hypothetical protein